MEYKSQTAVQLYATVKIVSFYLPNLPYVTLDFFYKTRGTVHPLSHPFLPFRTKIISKPAFKSNKNTPKEFPHLPTIFLMNV